MDSEDKKLIKELYNLTDKEVEEADKLYRRSYYSICGSAKVILKRRIESE